MIERQGRPERKPVGLMFSSTSTSTQSPARSAGTRFALVRRNLPRPDCLIISHPEFDLDVEQLYRTSLKEGVQGSQMRDTQIRHLHLERNPTGYRLIIQEDFQPWGVRKICRHYTSGPARSVRIVIVKLRTQKSKSSSPRQTICPMLRGTAFCEDRRQEEVR